MFANETECMEYLAAENCWSLLKKVARQEGEKVQFRCNRVKRRGKPCDAGVYYVRNFAPSDTSVKLYRKNMPHSCSEENGVKKIPDEARQFIEGQVELGNYPKTIMFKLRQNTEFNFITKNQVTHIINTYKKQKFGNPAVTLSDLENFFRLNNAVPEGDDDPYVVNFDRSNSEDEDKRFRLFYSTKRLLQHALQSNVVHIDGTYKIIVQGFPVLVIGVSDYAKVFHLCGLAICSSEGSADFQFVIESLMHGVIQVANKDLKPKAFVGDASQSITKAIADAFDDDQTCPDRVYCFFHVMMNVDKFKFNNQANKEPVKEDIHILQKSFNEKMFRVGAKLFLTKWAKNEKEFVEHFEKVYLMSNYNWYAGCAPSTPKTNNCLESFNKSLKQHQTFYKRMNLAEFKVRALEIVRERSMEYISDKQPPLQTVEVSEKLLNSGWEYSTSKKSFVSFKQPGDDGVVDFYVFAGDNLDKITKEHVDKFKTQTFKKFDTFAEKAFAIHQITFKPNSQKWATDSLCTCQSFSKDFICKHVVGIAYRTGILNAPNQVSNAAEGPISAKNKRGRPRKATKALIID